jgi:hypothetical protein
MEIAAICAGILSILAGFLPGLPATRRAVAILGGAGFAFYGFYVLNQTSGTWEFPIYLFLLPLLVIGSVAASAGQRRDQ